MVIQLVHGGKHSGAPPSLQIVDKRTKAVAKEETHNLEVEGKGNTPTGSLPKSLEL